ncbi:hypothetical protein PAHAL_5G429300 [Panicum hallii]|uniref:Uncharacterized protein n=1 Tax=Panicum hallii TaxID=206008 RepID=A0A2T8IN26_9POAL|nr:hypothetical protein PAHAL_5G429300 [Panicum hallii]
MRECPPQNFCSVLFVGSTPLSVCCPLWFWIDCCSCDFVCVLREFSFFSSQSRCVIFSSRAFDLVFLALIWAMT